MTLKMLHLYALILEKYIKIPQKSISKHLEDSQIDVSLEETIK